MNHYESAEYVPPGFFKLKFNYKIFLQASKNMFNGFILLHRSK